MAARAPPFFPSSGPKPHDAGAGARPAAEGAISVSELTRRVKVSLERDPALSSVRVRGEMSNFLHHSSGHMYFVLKDEEAVLRCVLWNGTARKLRFSPQDGLEVVAHGSITVYPRRGEYQLTVAVLEPAGEGALYAAFLRMKAKLEGEGLFAADRKRPISPFPRRVVIVTSREGAVLHDFLRISRRRDPAVEVVLVPAPVQGPDAAPELALALGRAANVPGADVVVLARGGGSLEDLWAFNEEVLARAIAASPVPVVSAVGHETDYTIADFVADLRAPTPSAAAELVAAESGELVSRVGDLRSALVRALSYYLLVRRSELRDLVESRGFAETAGAVISLSAKRR
ncbi:MAG: exodeoxyribonuclease VII large subunit, partial [Methanobacteriota archaeon]